jgi:hypothetical protein
MTTRLSAPRKTMLGMVYHPLISHVYDVRITDTLTQLSIHNFGTMLRTLGWPFDQPNVIVFRETCMGALRHSIPLNIIRNMELFVSLGYFPALAAYTRPKMDQLTQHDTNGTLCRFFSGLVSTLSIGISL